MARLWRRPMFAFIRPTAGGGSIGEGGPKESPKGFSPAETAWDSSQPRRIVDPLLEPGLQTNRAAKLDRSPFSSISSSPPPSPSSSSLSVSDRSAIRLCESLARVSPLSRISEDPADGEWRRTIPSRARAAASSLP